MNLADVFAIFLVLAGFVIVFVSYWLMAAGLFPAFVARAADRLATSPLKSFLLGLVTLGPLVVAGFAGSARAHQGGVKLLALTLVVLPMLGALFGSAGWALRVGQGLKAGRDARDPWRRVLRGGIVVGLAFVLPFIGTFAVLPFVFISGFGAALLCWRRRAPAALAVPSPAPMPALASPPLISIPEVV